MDHQPHHHPQHPVISLVRMRPETFPTFIRQAVESSMEDLESLDRWPRAKALEIARSEMERLLPEGLATPNHILLEILENNKGPTIGFIWLSLGSKGSEQVAFVHQLLILPEHRRHGHARATLKTIEAALAAKGVAAIVLHVFNNNKAAQQFYSAVGYEVASLNLQKKLNRSDD